MPGFSQCSAHIYTRIEEAAKLVYYSCRADYLTGDEISRDFFRNVAVNMHVADGFKWKSLFFIVNRLIKLAYAIVFYYLHPNIEIVCLTVMVICSVQR